MILIVYDPTIVYDPGTILVQVLMIDDSNNE